MGLAGVCWLLSTWSWNGVMCVVSVEIPHPEGPRTLPELHATLFFSPRLMAISTFTFLLDKTTLARGSSPLGSGRQQKEVTHNARVCPGGGGGRAHVLKKTVEARLCCLLWPHIFGDRENVNKNASFKMGFVCAGEDDLSLNNSFYYY